MKISETFPSKYLSAADLQGREPKVIMANVEMEKLGNDMKPVLYFKGKEKGLCLNKTNGNTIASAYGDDTEDWFGREIVLFQVITDYQGKTTPAIRVRIPTARDNKSTAPAIPPTPPRNGNGGHSVEAPRRADPISSGPPPRSAADLDDEIPF